MNWSRHPQTITPDQNINYCDESYTYNFDMQEPQNYDETDEAFQYADPNTVENFRVQASGSHPKQS